MGDDEVDRLGPVSAKVVTAMLREAHSLPRRAAPRRAVLAVEARSTSRHD